MRSHRSRQQQKQQTRQQIVRVAAKVISHSGFLAARTGDIARSAGLAHGSIFAHFHTREGLVLAVVEEMGEKIASRVRRLVSQGGSLRDVLSAHVEGLMEYESFYTRLILEGPLLPEDSRRVIVGIQSALASQLEEAMQREIKEGRIRRLPLPFAFNTWIGLIHYYLANRDLFAPGVSVLRKWGTKLVSYYLDLLAA